MNLSDSELKELLKKHFDRDNFEPFQQEIITSLLSGDNVLVVTNGRYDPTILYKLPALVSDGLTLVVSLTHKIVETEDSAFLPTTHINNSLTPRYLQERIWDMAEGKYRLIYAGVEQFRNRTFLFAISKLPISLLVVEDAHRISRLGYDFQPDYLNISRILLEMDDNPRILALSGACTRHTQDEILQKLEIENAKVFLTDLSMPNVSLEVKFASSHEAKYEILEESIKNLEGAGIIYVNSRRTIVEICRFLKRLELQVSNYHSGLTKEGRIRVKKEFISNKVRIVVATRSFSLDLDKPDIRFVIHFDMPDSLDRYYEQISMAGRDGQPARGILICSPADKGFHYSMIERGTASLTEIWQVNDVLKRYANENKSQTIETTVKDRTEVAQRRRNSEDKKLDDWLNDHFKQLSAEIQKLLMDLRDSYDGTSRPKDSEYGEGWQEFSKQMRAEYEFCEICGAKSEIVHHKHYKTFGNERPEDVAVLCNMCHYFIHPDSQMTQEAFEQRAELSKLQPDLIDKLDSDTRSIVVIPYEKLSAESAIDYNKASYILREMETAGMLSILPDCSEQARIRILVPSSELSFYTEDETGRVVAKWLMESSEFEPRAEFNIDLSFLSRELSCRHDALEHSLIVLNHAGAISYIPYRFSTTLSLIDLDISLTDKAFEELKGVRYNFLRAIEEYARTKRCRQRFLCGYFGDEIPDDCGLCDNCANISAGIAESEFTIDSIPENTSPVLPKYIKEILKFINKNEGGLSKKAVAEILSGVMDRTTRFDKWSEFGILSDLTSKQILDITDLLIEYGLLKEGNSGNSTVDLTQKGFRVLRDEPEPEDERILIALIDDLGQIAPSQELPAFSSQNPDRNKILITILQCVRETEGRISRRDLVNLLCGQNSKRMMKHGFDHMEKFGSLAHLSAKVILENIDELIDRGCIAVNSLFFPMLELTEAGKKRLYKLKIW